MPKLISFTVADFGAAATTFQSNDPDLTLNGADVDIASAFVASGSWTLYDQPGFQGTSITLTEAGGPDADGCYRDYADWAGTAIFHVRSIQHS